MQEQDALIVRNVAHTLSWLSLASEAESSNLLEYGMFYDVFFTYGKVQNV
jgi:hypothetical protein